MSNLKLPTMTIANLKKVRNTDGSIGYKTDIMWNADKTKVGIYHHDSLIAVIDESGTAGHSRIVSISTAGWASNTTINRIRKILQDNTLNASARIKDYTPYLFVTVRGAQYGVDISGRTFYSLIVNDLADNYVNSIITDESLYNGVH